MIRVLVVDDEKPARDRMKRLLRDHADVTCVGEASDGREALERIAEGPPTSCFSTCRCPS